MTLHCAATDVRLALWILAASLLVYGLASQHALVLAAVGCSAGASIVGLASLVAFHAHTAKLVFNAGGVRPCHFSSLWAMFQMTRPLELVWRLATASCRDTPDLLLLGEARCGTTSLGSQIKECLPGAAPPFW